MPMPGNPYPLYFQIFRGEYIYKTQKKQMHTYLIIPTHLLHQVYIENLFIQCNDDQNGPFKIILHNAWLPLSKVESFFFYKIRVHE